MNFDFLLNNNKKISTYNKSIKYTPFPPASRLPAKELYPILSKFIISCCPTNNSATNKVHKHTGPKQNPNPTPHPEPKPHPKPKHNPIETCKFLLWTETESGTETKSTIKSATCYPGLALTANPSFPALSANAIWCLKTTSKIYNPRLPNTELPHIHVLLR